MRKIYNCIKRGFSTKMTRKREFFLGIFFLIATIIGVLLLLNRYRIAIFANTTLRILADHFFAGFLIPIWGYILYLGISSFFVPNRRVEYRKMGLLYTSIIWLLVFIIWGGTISTLETGNKYSLKF